MLILSCTRCHLSPLLLWAVGEMGEHRKMFTLTQEMHKRECHARCKIKYLEKGDHREIYFCYSPLLRSLIIIDLNIFFLTLQILSQGIQVMCSVNLIKQRKICCFNPCCFSRLVIEKVNKM